MARVPSEVHNLFRRQHGVASTQQLRSHDLTRGMVDDLLRHGDFVPMMRGVVASPDIEISELSKCAALSLSHPRVVISGPTAGRLWGFRRVATDWRIHALAPRHWRASNEKWCVVYRTDAIHGDDIIERADGIRVTSRARTALDLARSVRDPDRLLSIIEQAANDGGLRDGDLRAVAVDWARRRTWVRRYLDQVDRRLDGPAAESEPEVLVGAALAEAGVKGLVRQHPIQLDGYGMARFDLAVPERHWAIEVDVFPTHRETAGAKHDEARDAASRSHGWTVRRISESSYRHRFDATIDALAHEFRHMTTAA